MREWGFLLLLVALALLDAADAAFDASVGKCYRPSKECAVPRSTDPTSAYQALVANHMCIEDDKACLAKSDIGCGFLDGHSVSCRRCFTSCDNAASFLERSGASSSTLVNFCGYGTTIQYCDVCVDGARCPDQTLTEQPTPSPTRPRPTPKPTAAPATEEPTSGPTRSPTKAPSKAPTSKPATVPTRAPTKLTVSPTMMDTTSPTGSPTLSPTHKPRKEHTGTPTSAPTVEASTSMPSQAPISAPSREPTRAPKRDEKSEKPTRPPRTNKPTTTAAPTKAPKTDAPTEAPSAKPTKAPKTETEKPTAAPTAMPSTAPTATPSSAPATPTAAPSATPTVAPSATAPPTVVPDVVILGQIQLPAPGAVAMGSATSGSYDPAEVQAALGVFFGVQEQHVNVTALPAGRRRLQQLLPQQSQQQQQHRHVSDISSHLHWQLHRHLSDISLHRRQQLHRHLADVQLASYDFVLEYFGDDAQAEAEQSLTAVDDASRWDTLGATLGVDPADVTINSLSYPAAPGEVSSAGAIGPVVMPTAAASSKGVSEKVWLWVSVSVGVLLVCLAAFSLAAGQQRRKRRRLERVQPRACGTGMSSLDTGDDGDLVGFCGRPAAAPGLKLVSVDLDGMGDDVTGYPTVVATGYATDAPSYGGSRRSRRMLMAPGAGHVLPAVALATSYAGSRAGDEFEGAMSMQHVGTPLASAGAAYGDWNGSNAPQEGGEDGSEDGTQGQSNAGNAAAAPVVTTAMMRAIRSLRSSGSEAVVSPTAAQWQNSGAAGSYRRHSNYSYSQSGARSQSQGSSYTYWVPPPPSDMGRSSSLHNSHGGGPNSTGGLPGLAAAVAESVRSVRQSSTARSFVTLPDDSASVTGRRAVALPAPMSPSSAGLGGQFQNGGRYGGHFHGGGGSSAWETSSAGGSPTRGSVVSSRHSSPTGGAIFERAWMQQRTLDQRVAAQPRRAEQPLVPEAVAGAGVEAWDSDPYRHGRGDPAAVEARESAQDVLPTATSRPELF